MANFREPFLEKILRKVRTDKVSRYIKGIDNICDIGCSNNAYFLKKISNKIKKGYGIDKKVDKCTNNKLILIENKLLKTLPFKDNFFEIVTLIAVIEHLDYPEYIINEVHRILKPEGLLILTTPTPESRKIIDFLTYKLNLLSREQISDHKYYWNKSDLTSLLSKCRFNKIEFKYFELLMNCLVCAKK